MESVYNVINQILTFCFQKEVVVLVLTTKQILKHALRNQTDIQIYQTIVGLLTMGIQIEY